MGVMNMRDLEICFSKDGVEGVEEREGRREWKRGREGGSEDGRRRESQGGRQGVKEGGRKEAREPDTKNSSSL